MSFLILCVVVSFVFQILALSAAKKHNLAVSLFPFILMELFPLSLIVYYAVKRPPGFLFDWKDNIVFGVWVAGAILLGCGLAWLVYWSGKEKK